MASKSVARPLVAVYGLLIGLLIVAVLVGALAVRNLRVPLRMATESGLETSVAGRELRSAIDVLEQIITTRTARVRPDAGAFRKSAEVQREEILEQGRRLIESAPPGPMLESLRAEIPQLTDEVNKIVALESALALSYESALSMGDATQTAANRAIALTREHASIFFDDNLSQTRRLADVRFNLSTLSLHSQAAINPIDEAALLSADSLFASQLRRAVYQVSVMTDYEEKRQLNQALSTLFEIGRGHDNLFGHARRAFNVESELKQQLAIFRQQIVTIHATSSGIAGVNDAATERTLQAARRALQRYQLALIVGSLLTVILGYFVLRRYVYDAVVMRLRRLSATTWRLSHGDLDATIDSDGNDEISEVNKALEVFRQNARDLATSEKALANRTAALEEVNRELDNFAYVASHDLRAPLHGVDTLASFVQEDLADTMPEESARHLALMRSRIQRLHGLLNSLLEFSRLGRREYKHELADADQLIRDCASLLEKPDFDISFDLNVGEVSLVTTPFEQVVRNLIDNAIKHHDMPHGRISIHSRVDDGVLLLAVGDDGPGIATKFHERVFGMFKTLKARDSVEGSGMGLTFLRKAVSQSGGTITIESDPSQKRGTVFHVRWPLTSSDMP